MIDATAYTISIRRAEFDGESCYEARVKELPDLAEYADSHAEAYELALDAIETTATVLEEQGRRMPAPATPVDDYSGRVTLRLPKTLHRSLAMKADDEGISLNHLLVSVLSTFRGFDAALQEDRDDWVMLVEDASTLSAKHSVSRGPSNVVTMKHYGQQAAAKWTG